MLFPTSFSLPFMYFSLDNRFQICRMKVSGMELSLSAKRERDYIMTNEEKAKLHKFLIGALLNFVLPLAVLLVGAKITGLLGLPAKVDTLNSGVEGFQSEVNAVDKKYDALDTRIIGVEEDIKEIRKDISELEDDIDTANDKLDKLQLFLNHFFFQSGLRPTDNFAQKVTTSFDSKDPLYSGSAQIISVSSSVPIAYHSSTKMNYTAEDLATQTLLFPYKNGTEDIFFYGQFSENGRWDGKCLINTYEHGKLKLITDAEYDDGVLIHSMQVFHYTMPYSKQKVWAISDRTNQGNYNSGETKLYYFTSDIQQDFLADDVAPGDMISAEDFKNAMQLDLYAYYYGNTSGGYFNDDTGTAYMIYFYDDGSVKTLYVGNFANGLFNDDTGNAWYLTEDVGSTYGYYKGKFKDSNPVGTSYKYGLTEAEINEIVGGREFNYPLIWSRFNKV